MLYFHWIKIIRNFLKEFSTTKNTKLFLIIIFDDKSNRIGETWKGYGDIYLKIAFPVHELHNRF